MRKAGLLVVFIIVFGLCGWLGFRATVSGLWTADEARADTPPTTAAQKNILIVSVDALVSPNPQLVSVWVLFAISSEPSPSLTFLPVYHRDGRYAQAMYLANTFALAPNGEPVDDFQNEVLTYLDINRFNAYVTLDTHAANVFARLFPGSQPTPQPFQVAALDDRLILRDLCTAIETRTGSAGAQLNWGEIVPDHFRTEVSFPEFTGDWNVFTQSELTPHCEVLDP